GLLQRDDEREAFLERLKGLSLSNPIMMGFGISSRDTLSYAFDHCQGGIIGSAFIRVLSEHHDQSKSIIDFIGALK
ncbi:MAG: tryptophan synthase subunit alpha, partial [Bdellovibrionales bacterium]|nr:tryptophan synthase subunit alpha [Bdellovibrionales bacterium]